jgi:hypothetical protein
VDVQRFRVRQEQLLLVELFGHLPLERPLEEYTQDYERHNKDRKYPNDHFITFHIILSSS